jgi:peptidoglycan/xylan/chitin deacetylase (PgdA/CDA1 family)
MKVPILMYHSVNRVSDDYLTVSQAVFRRQLEYLASACRVVGMSEALSAVHGAPESLDNAVLISFDDAFADNLDFALPVLDAFGYKATFFVPAEHIGKDNSWDYKAYRILPHMQAADIAGLHRLGHEIGCHSLTHQRLTKLPDAGLSRELEEADRILAGVTGQRPRVFAYPFGGVDARVSARCGKRYEASFATVRDGCFDWAADPSSIRRIYVSPQDEPAEIEYKIACYRKGKQHE